ncbi:MAG: hypothetical protein M3014_00515 [Chloroflexota bacterium]|nr:hypothetical protein [Chloroflexota bacterium]
MLAVCTPTGTQQARETLALLAQVLSHLMDEGTTQPPAGAEQAPTCTEELDKNSAVSDFERAMSRLDCSREEMLSIWAALSCAERAAVSLLSPDARHPQQAPAALTGKAVQIREPVPSEVG